MRHVLVPYLVLVVGCGGGNDDANPGAAGSSSAGTAGSGSTAGAGGAGGSAAGSGSSGSSAGGGSGSGSGSLDAAFVPSRIASKEGGNCVITKEQLLYCWGGSVPSASEIKYVQVSAQFDKLCAILAGNDVPTGNVWCFTAGPLNTNTPPGIFEEVRVSEHGACARNAQDLLTCWTDGDADAAALVSGAPTAPVKSFYLMQDTACAVMAAGGVQCWGRDLEDFGRLTPARTDYLVVGGYRQLYGIAPDGSISGWGLGDVEPSAPDGKGFVQLAAGDDHIAGLHSDGSVSSEGSDAADAPTDVELVELSAGKGQTCGITKAGGVTCWGKGTTAEFKPPPEPQQIF